MMASVYRRTCRSGLDCFVVLHVLAHINGAMFQLNMTYSPMLNA